MSETTVLESLQDRVLTLTLHRPERRNAIAPEMTQELLDKLKRAAVNPDVGAIVLTGTGPTFCVGGDVGSMSEKKTISPAELREKLVMSAEAVLLLRSIPKPTIAMIRGAVAGGGLGFALGCDLRYGDDTAKMTYAYTKIALGGDFVVNWLLERLIGTAKAREFAFFSPVIAAAELEKIGLLHALFSGDTLESNVMEKARQLAHSSTNALGEIKSNLNAAVEKSLDEAVAIEIESFIRCRQTADHRESAMAFLEKRPPQFNRG